MGSEVFPFEILINFFNGLGNSNFCFNISVHAFGSIFHVHLF
jgi:hypothetical protein